MATEATSRFTSRLEAAARDVVIHWDGGGSLTALETKLERLQEALEDYPPQPSSKLPDAPWTSLSLIELRAWAYASERSARNEGFERVADSIVQWIDWFTALRDEHVSAVYLTPREPDDEN